MLSCNYHNCFYKLLACYIIPIFTLFCLTVRAKKILMKANMMAGELVHKVNLPQVKV